MVIKSIFLALSLMASFGVYAEDAAASLSQTTYVDEVLLLQQEVELATAPVKSKEKFSLYFSATPSSVFFKLPVSVQDSFRKSLVFTEKGLASYSYASLSDYLSVQQIYELLSIFGAQKTISSIPGIVAKTSIEKKIIDSNAPTATPMGLGEGKVCVINGSTKQIQCMPRYKSVCSRACDGTE
ncbi:hypothetical protein [Xanthomonas graminis]|uniref:hypothetical protein n=2 Tax=Xanthomonas graminis TaxID=3390026 RepID=UPI001112EAAD|nr:hypothetical protein [Xanthomonas translucens]